MEPRALQIGAWSYTTELPVLRYLCNKCNKGFTGLTWYGKKVRHVKILARCGMPRHAAACCGMLQNPHQQLPESGAAACCGMLLPLVLAGGGKNGGKMTIFNDQKTSIAYRQGPKSVSGVPELYRNPNALVRLTPAAARF